MYATVAGTKAKYSRELLIRLTNFEGVDAFTAITDSVLEGALDDASDLIDGYIQERYPTPFPTPPPYFEVDTMTIAIMLLIQRKGYLKDSPDEALYNAGQDAIKMRYEKISQGKISIGSTGGTGATVPATNVLASYPDAIFSQETLDKF
jgi:phage gp36-like protein